jgi:predicted AlkP superfamily pyrophosphatase or phosphodiesterase
MRRFLFFILLAATLLAATLAAATPKKPKLVLVIVVDQCRYDYMTRYRADYKGGFDRLLKNGASFTSAHDDFFPSITSVAHAAILTGAMPSATGIVGNDWFDHPSGKPTSSINDVNTKMVGGSGGRGSSPHWLLVSTVGDELKAANGGRPKVIGISSKERSAILPAGRKADAAFWFDDTSGEYVSSTYYMNTLPEWVKKYNTLHSADPYLGMTWLGHRIPDTSTPKYRPVSYSPFGSRLTGDMAERALAAEQLGKHADPDLLSVSFSSPDYVGHDYGPDSPEEHEALLEMDRILDKLFQTVDREVGLSNTMVVLTADHGVAPRGNGGQLKTSLIKDAVQKALTEKYGEGNWIAGNWDVLVYLNHDLIAQKKLDLAEVNKTAAAAIRGVPHVARTFTREQLLDPRAKWDETGRLVLNGFNPERAADVVFLPEMYWVFSETTHYNHGTTYDYDTHVPLIFMGAGIHAGSYDSAARTNDIAVTLADILRVPKPNAAIGRVLTEMFDK